MFIIPIFYIVTRIKVMVLLKEDDNILFYSYFTIWIQLIITKDIVYNVKFEGMNFPK